MYRTGDGQSKRPAVSQGCQTDRSTLKPSSLASVKVNIWKIAVVQGAGAKVPSPDVLAWNYCSTGHFFVCAGRLKTTPLPQIILLMGAGISFLFLGEMCAFVSSSH